jgi:hypothetical protein
MIEYVVALHLTAAACAHTPGCQVIPPGQGYASLIPAQNPNWCVLNPGLVAYDFAYRCYFISNADGSRSKAMRAAARPHRTKTYELTHEQEVAPSHF